VPLVVGLGISAYRTSSLLLPIVVLFRFLPRPVLLVLIALSIPLAYALTVGVLTGPLL
jgi:hypothetical protein